MKRQAIDINILFTCAFCGLPVRTENNGTIEDSTVEGIEIGFEPCACDEGRLRDELDALRLLVSRGYTHFRRHGVDRTLERIEREMSQAPPELPEGVTPVPMSDPAAMHNAIADAVGEDSAS